MFTTGRIRRLAVLAPVAALALIFACSDSGTDGPPVEGDCTTLTAQANAALAALMQGDIDSIINHGDSTFRPHDVDFSIPHGLYQQALAADPNCADAKMGAAFTGVLMFMTDADFNSLVEKFKHAYDTLTFNPMRPNSLAPAVGFGGDILTDAIPLKAGRFTGLIPSPLELDRAALRLAAVDPDLTALQDRLEESLLPKIRSARTRLLDLVADPDYTFEITPAMQGNEGAEPVLLDRSDIQLFIAMTYAAEAGLEVFFARNLSLSAYTTAGVEEALARTSEFLSLKSGGVGTQHMGNAKQCVLDAVNALKTAIGYLRAEIDTYQP
ncbi:MAG TPA: hypothetical protein PKY95_11100, partial [candidate division Zixibacteria bacterium]|nr:hypothetical protein [candidate division Zixibacteria bacterium]